MNKELRILLLEDLASDAELIERELRRAGLSFTSTRVMTKEDFTAQLSQCRPELILSDYSLPGFDGLSALALARHYCPDVPFIFISGTLGEELAIETLKNGATDYVLKDRLARLGPAVQRALSEASEKIERKRAEESLSLSNNRLRAIIEAAPLAIFALDLAGQALSWNPAAERLYGWPAAEVLGHKLPIRLEDQAAWIDICAAVQRNESVIGVELRHGRRDGIWLEVRANVAPLHDGQGQVEGCLAMLEDITEQKKLESQLRQAQRMESIGTLAGGVAHDFNNMLTGIIGFTDLIMLQTSSDHPIYRHLEQVKRLGERAAQLTRQLLAFARRQMIEPRPLNLNNVISDLTKFLRRVIGEQIDLELRLAPDLGTVEADVSQLEQILLNLCINARDAMPKGGKLTLETTEVTLDEEYCHRHSWARPGHYAQLSVNDTGIGMDRLTQQRIFEPFFTTKEVGKGTGLGLSMVYGIIKQHEGLIHVYSEVGHGTTFKIYLPLTSAPIRAEERPTAVRPMTGQETILVAEDEPLVRELIVESLQVQGYRVLATINGEEALRTFAEHEDEVALVLSDTVMPKMGGRELYEALHLLKPKLKFLFISGYSTNAMSEHFVIKEGLDLLQKPFGPLDLVRKLREVLDRPE